MEIRSDTIFIKRDIQNSFGKIISDKSSYIYNKEINFIWNYQLYLKKNLRIIKIIHFIKIISISNKRKKCRKNCKKLNISFKPKISVIIPLIIFFYLFAMGNF